MLSKGFSLEGFYIEDGPDGSKASNKLENSSLGYSAENMKKFDKEGEFCKDEMQLR